MELPGLILALAVALFLYVVVRLRRRGRLDARAEAVRAAAERGGLVFHGPRPKRERPGLIALPPFRGFFRASLFARGEFRNAVEARSDDGPTVWLFDCGYAGGEPQPLATGVGHVHWDRLALPPFVLAPRGTLEALASRRTATPLEFDASLDEQFVLLGDAGLGLRPLFFPREVREALDGLRAVAPRTQVVVAAAGPDLMFHYVDHVVEPDELATVAAHLSTLARGFASVAV